MKKLLAFFNRSFQRKLLIFNLVSVILTAIVLFVFLTVSFRSVNDFSLALNTDSMEQTVQDFLMRSVREQSDITWLQLKAAQDNLSVLGRTAQKIVDHAADIQANQSIFQTPLFQNPLTEESGALTSPVDASFDALIPPPIAADPRAQQQLALFSLLNLSMDAVFDGNVNNASIYFVGDQSSPVMLSYPNYHRIITLRGQEALDSLYWRDFFSTNIDGWERYYTDAGLQQQFPNPVTVEEPYYDAGGRGLVVTMFYPLWDHQGAQFAGAVGVDIALNKMIENILSIHIAETGFAFLVDGQGKIIAMPEAGVELFQITYEEKLLGSLVYYEGALDTSSDLAVQELSALMVASQEGYERLALTDLGGNLRQEMVAYASLPPFTMPGYVEDSWKIVIVVPEEEIFSALNQTRQQVQEQSLRVSLLSLVILVAILAFVSLVTVRFSTNATRDLRTLARAADGISAKNYDMELKLRSQDEIGQLGRAFETMSGEIREYTVNLEGKVAERTADLRKANDEISRLNDQLRGENLRLGAELDVARRLQLMVLPPEQETSNIPDLDIASFMRPADEVGGDYYDVLRVGETVYLGIGDVTGHGLPSGVIMLMAQTALLTLSKSGEKDMERMLSILNQVLYNNILRIHEDKNMTMAILKYRNREFSIVGQHESVLVCRQDGSLEVVDTMDLGMPIGLEEDIEKYIMTSQIKLQTGDTLLLYTDGVTEAFGRKKKQFGIDGLKNSLVRHHKMDARGVMEHILADLYVHIGEATIFDDIAILVIKQK